MAEVSWRMRGAAALVVDGADDEDCLALIALADAAMIRAFLAKRARIITLIRKARMMEKSAEVS